MGLTVNQIGAFIMLKNKYNEQLKKDGVYENTNDDDMIASVIDSNNKVFDIMKQCNSMIYSLKLSDEPMSDEDRERITSIKNMFQEGINVANEIMKVINIILE